MLGYNKYYSHENQKNYMVWADFYTVFRIYFRLRITEGCN